MESDFAVDMDPDVDLDLDGFHIDGTFSIMAFA
jgi:hypothetical protein